MASTKLNEDIKNNTLYKKLERVLTRDWWPNYQFDKEAFHIYCEAVRCEANLFYPEFIGSKKYKQLVKMSDDRLRRYLLNSKRSID